ncbi:MAG: RagB/SusD family nutrient uptake outer membrane protein [Bacteroidota bacterium]
MKKNLIIYLTIFAITLTSCEKLLDKEPTDKLSIADLFKDISGAKTALAGAYSGLLSEDYYQKNMMVYPDLLGGNIKYSKTLNTILNDIYDVVQTPIESSMNATYTNLYQQLNNVNNVIQYTATAAGSNTEKTKIIAEAKCLRALLHFDLLRIFAQPFNFTSNANHPGIVINLKPQLFGDAPPIRSSVAQCYQAIITDLVESIANFDNTNTAVLAGGAKQNYFTKASAQALLAKVYLYQNNWDLAFSTADELIKSNQYSLITNANYVASWTGRTPSSESIFEIALEVNFSSNGLGAYFDIANLTYRQYAATNDILGLYTNTDVRRNTSMFNSVAINSVNFLFTKKYATGGTSATPIKVLRLSDIYLIRAEAAAEKSNPDFITANADLNLIRKRADPSASSLNLTAKTDLINAILLERRKEFAFEGNLLFDLIRKKQNIVRTDCNAQTCNLNFGDNRLIMPLPANTIISNNSIFQNPGY